MSRHENDHRVQFATNRRGEIRLRGAHRFSFSTSMWMRKNYLYILNDETSFARILNRLELAKERAKCSSVWQIRKINGSFSIAVGGAFWCARIFVRFLFLWDYNAFKFLQSTRAWDKFENIFLFLFFLKSLLRVQEVESFSLDALPGTRKEK